MKIVFLLSALALGVFSSGCVSSTSESAASSAPAAPPRVNIDTGPVQGQIIDGVQSFRGIPYAAPPVGDLRWRRPQPALPWSSTLYATKYGRFCPQYEQDVLWFELGEMSEDCLTLNVQTTAAGTDAKLPVMVWIHGGGYVNGSGNIARLNGTAIAKQDVILVTINYRLAMFGFMTHPALASGDPKNPQGNYGLLDIQASLEWVQRNIESFGGDPDNVTIFGESAGAGFVNFLMVMPSSKGLFQQAISQSSSVGIAPDPYIDRRAGFLPASNTAGVAYAKKLGIENYADATPEVAAALRAINVSDFMAAMEPAERFTPVVDGFVIPDQVGALLAAGLQHKVPYITGGVSWEASLGRSIGGGFSPEFAGKLVPAAEKEKLYTGLEGEALDDQIFGDLIVLSASRSFAEHMARYKVPVYRYYMSYVATARRDSQPGVAHADDIAFVMQTLDTEKDLDVISNDDRRVSRLMSSYWTQFARTGNPNRADLPDWPVWEPENGVTLEISESTTVQAWPLEDRMQFHMRRGLDLLEKARK